MDLIARTPHPKRQRTYRGGQRALAICLKAHDLAGGSLVILASYPPLRPCMSYALPGKSSPRPTTSM
jgi:hypothetical protein